MKRLARSIWSVALSLAALGGLAQAATLGSNCTATVQNRTVRVNANGTFSIPNIPVDQGLYRVRVVCKRADGTTALGQSDFVRFTPNGTTNFPNIQMGVFDPIPVSIQAVAFKTVLTSQGDTSQISVRGYMPSGSIKSLTEATTGTQYTSSNLKIITVSADGLVTAVGKGKAVVSVRNEGQLSSVMFSVDFPVDTDGDGLPDDWEIANGLNPNDPSDASKDADNDGLTNLQEYQLGTNPRNADTDGDGVKDGDEVTAGTNPLKADSDGDGLTDGQEKKLGTNPLSADTDGDGISDGTEVTLGLNAKVANITTTVVGRVVDANGNPVNGASVVVFKQLSGNTDPTGYFSLPFVPTNLGNIQVLARVITAGDINDATSVSKPPVGNGTTDVGVIQLSPNSGVVRGLVSDLRARPVPNAQVNLVDGYDKRNAVTDITGIYRIPALAAGPIYVRGFDPKSGLRGQNTGLLLPNLSATINIGLGPAGTIRGTVYGRDAVTPQVGATVSLNGQAPVKTDIFGRYSIDFAPLGNFTIEASDSAGNRGRTAGFLSATNQVILADITYLGRGTVTGTVVDGSNNPVPNATVVLNSGSIFGGQTTVVTDGSGAYTVNNVFVGAFSVSARAPIARLGGSASGNILSDGQTVTANIQLVAAGSIAGTIFRADGSTIVPNAQINLSNGLTGQSDGNGNYRFDFLPIGGYTVDVTDPTTGDRGRSSGNVASQDQVVTVNVNLVGQGTVVVTVLDATGANVNGATVTLNGSTIFGGSQAGTTQPDGTISFTKVLAGTFNVYATNPATQLSGSSSGSVAAGATSNITITLQGAGTVQGTVFQPDGVTPAAYAIVRINGQKTKQMFSGTDGSFRFDVMPTGGYSIAVYDSKNFLRAYADGIQVNTDGQVVTQNLTLHGNGSVTGTVTDPDGNPVAGIGVSLSSSAGSFAHSAFAYTNSGGVYNMTDIPVGGFTVTASRVTAEARYYGQNTGEVTGDGQLATADIALSATAIALTPGSPTSFFDANNLVYNIDPSGALTYGNRNIFLGDNRQNKGGFLLDVTVDSNTTRFGGQTVGTLEVGGRQLAISQNNINGLNVTRKVWVPRTGYFARYLEIVTNTTNAPITLDATVTSNFTFINKVQNGFTFSREPRIIVTSSGDTQFDVSVPETRDHWLEIDDDDDGDPFLLNTLPATALVFDGAGAPVQATNGSYNIDFTNNYGQFVAQFQGLTVPANTTVALMHFVTQGVSRNGASTGADRLENLAPEALADATFPDVAAHMQKLSDDMASLVLYLSNFYYGNSFLEQTLAGQASTLNGTIQNLYTTGASDPQQLSDAATQAVTLAKSIDSDMVLLQYRSFCPVDPGTGGCPLTPIQFGNLGGAINVRKSVATLTSSAGQMLDLAKVVNFVVPLNAPNPTTPLPDVTGSVNGTVLAGDSITPVPYAPVVFKSNNPIYGRTYNLGSNGAGYYQLNSSFNDYGGSTAIAIDAYNVFATHPLTGAVSPSFTANFGEGETQASKDIVFSNTGVLTGTVRRHNGVVVSNGYVDIIGSQNLRSGIAQDGQYGMTGVMPGSYALTAVLGHPQGTALTGTSVAVMSEGATTSVDIFITPTGGVTGTVRRADNSVSFGTNVTLTGANNFFRGTQTDTGGRFSFFDVPVGDYRIDAVESVTNTAATSTLSVTVDTVTTKDLTLSVGGTVLGTVTNVANQPVAGVQITVASGGKTFNTLSDALGKYRVDGVPPGFVSVQALDPVSTFLGQAQGSLALSGDVLTLNIRLYSAGKVQGTIFRFDGTTPVPGATVRLTANSYDRTVTADGSGQYLFEAVPVGGFNVDATDGATGDRGHTSNQVNANGEIRTINLNLNGLGTVVVTVKDASNNLVSGATVYVQCYGNFYCYQQGTSAGDGTATFNNVFAGQIYTSATQPNTGLSGSTSGTLTAGATKALTINLQPAGQITGIVYQPDGVTPIAGQQVQAYGPVYRTTNTAEDGSYRFDAMALGTYDVRVYDGNSRLRARAYPVPLNFNGDTAVRNLVLTPIATVHGTITLPDTTAAAGASVTLSGSNPLISYYQTTTTDSAGAYQFTGVPGGNFTVTAYDATNTKGGSATGTVTVDGQSLTVDIQLSDNSITLPTYLYDANDSYYQVRENGAIFDSVHGIFYGDYYNCYCLSGNEGASVLDIVSNGTPSRFNGAPVGVKDINNQQITIRQVNVAGLDVTRKVYIPLNGYFARYLEILRNPTADPITVDVKVSENMMAGYVYYSGVPTVKKTSSGDNVLEVSDANNPDRWVTLRGSYDLDPFEAYYSDPAPFFTFDGPGAAERSGAVTYSTIPNYFYYPASQVVHSWTSVTVQPGATVAYMHFLGQELYNLSAQTAADRLMNLPPEALTGLQQDEIAAIRNFNVPADGNSLLPALGSLDGSITGAVLAGDNTTVIPNSTVRFQSKDQLFRRTLRLTSDGNGQFTFTGGASNGRRTTVPAEPFTLIATHPQTGIDSPVANGSFPAGQAQTTQNVVFTGTGGLSGVVKYANGATVTNGGYVYINGGSPSIGLNLNLDGSGNFGVSAIPQGGYSATAYVYEPRGSNITGNTTFGITSGQTTSLTVNLNPVGTVSGTVFQSNGVTPAAGVYVYLYYLSGNYVSRSVYTDGNGQFSFADVPSGGSVRVTATEPNTGVPTTADLSPVADTVNTVNLTLVALGSVQVQVNYANGQPVIGTEVDFYRNGSYFTYRYTDSNGQASVANVAVGTITARAYNPNNYNLFTEVSGSLVNAGDTLGLTVTLQGTGTIHGTVTYANGTVVSGGYLYLYRNGNYIAYASTDSFGNYTFNNVPAGETILVRAYNPSDGSSYREATTTLTADGESQTLNIALPATASILLTVTHGDSSAYSGLYVFLQDTRYSYSRMMGSTNGNGQLTINNVQEGAYTVSVCSGYYYNYSYGYQCSGFLSSASGTVQPADQGTTLNVNITINTATVTGTVYRGDGTTKAAGYTYITLYNADTNDVITTGYTDYYTSVYTFSNVAIPAGGVRAHAQGYNNYLATADNTGSTTQGGTLTLDLTLPISRVKGYVYAADGTTPVPNAQITFFKPDADGGGNAYPYSYGTDSSGYYQNDDVITSPNGVVVVATAPNNNAITASATGVPASPGADIQVDLTLPSGLVHGTIKYADGTPVQYPTVFAVVTDATEGFETYYYANENNDGTYVLVGIPVGPFTLYAQDSNSGAFKSVTDTIASDTEIKTLDVTLDPTGTVEGTFTYADGATTVDCNSVYLDSSGGALFYDIYAYTACGGAANPGQRVTETVPGHFTFEHVPFGYVVATGSRYDGNAYQVAANSGLLQDAINSLVLDLRLPTTGTVTGTLYNSDGITPVANGYVYINVNDNMGASGSYYESNSTDGNGVYTFTNVPLGGVRVYEYGSGGGLTTGVLSSTLDPLTLDVTRGTATSNTTTLDATDLFRYRVNNDGSLRGGTYDNRYSDPYDYANYLRVNGGYFDYTDMFVQEMDGRQINKVFGGAGGFRVTRKVFVPTEGGFARYLEIVTNPTNQTMTARVQVASYLYAYGEGGGGGGYYPWRMQADPSTNGNTFIVTDVAECCYPTLAWVAGGSGSPSAPADAFVLNPDASNEYFEAVWYGYTMTLQPGETKILMHFAIRKEQNDIAGTVSAAQALVNLSNPSSLLGMTTDEKSKVVNFVIP